MPRTPQPPPSMDDDTESNTLAVTDYNRTFLKPIIDQLQEGDTCTIQITGVVTNARETKTSDGGYMCELEMEPTKGRLVGSGGSGGGTMTSQMKRDQQKRAGQEEDDEEY